jgi:hypothetical protein
MLTELVSLVNKSAGVNHKPLNVAKTSSSSYPVGVDCTSTMS